MKVLNLNIWNQNYYWDKRLQVILSMFQDNGITGNGDDVLFFNEIANTPEHNQLDEINSNLGYKNKVFFEAKRNDNKGTSAGMGLLTNLDVKRQQIIPLSQNLSDPDDQFPRILSLIEIQSPRGFFVFAGLHMAISFDSQVDNAREVVENIYGFNINNFPVILCADMNCGPNEFPSNIFRSEGFLDSWQDLGKKEESTWPINRDLIIQNHRIKYNTDLSFDIDPRRMDMVWTKKVQVKKIEKIGKKIENLWHSDHWGLLAEF